MKKVRQRPMKIECPECNATLFLDEFPDFPAVHVCEECGACFDLESHLVFDEKSFGADREIGVPLGE
jgi:hypothetical protein